MVKEVDLVDSHQEEVAQGHQVVVDGLLEDHDLHRHTQDHLQVIQDPLQLQLLHINHPLLLHMVGTFQVRKFSQYKNFVSKIIF